MTRTWIVLCAVTALLTGMRLPSNAAESRVRIPGIYSGLSYHQESGDLLGTELFIVPSSDQQDGYVVFVQRWEGGTTFPVVVAVQVDGNELVFEVPAPSLAKGEYRGRVTEKGFTGIWRYRMSDGSYREEPIQLSRKKSYWE
jgi:hypothetical protein